MSGKISVLLVEDDIVDADLVKRAFASVTPEIFEVLHVDRFRRAVQSIKQQTFHVIILDLGLPDSVGLNAVENLMSLIPDIPVIVLTGSGDDDVAMIGIELGAQEFLSKGDVTAPMLIRTIRHAMKRMAHSIRRTGGEMNEQQESKLDQLSEAVRQSAKEIETNTQTLSATELTEQQRMLLADIEESSKRSLAALNEVVPANAELVEAQITDDDEDE